MKRSRSRSFEAVHSDDLDNDLNHSDEEMAPVKKEAIVEKKKARKKPA